ncbi:MAG: TonB-dependent receptor [Sphingomonadales bacterium]|nr:TonB-dependent receptor [Sphingomonadales bacterium]
MMKTILLASAAFGAMSLSGTAMAQTAPPAAEAATTDLSDIVVTAQRRSERLKDVPLTLTALSSSDLAKSGVTSARNLQNVVSGFTFSAFGTSPEPSIRGVSTTLSAPGAENPNALYIDGIYYGAQPVLANDFGDIERVEILKGPQGTLFGRNATGGAIQIFTKQPSFDPHVDVSVDGGYYLGSGESHSAPHVNFRGFVTGPIIAEKVAVSLAGGYNYTSGYYTNVVTGQSEGKTSQASLRAKLLITPTDTLKITLSSYYINNSTHETFTEFAVDGLAAASLFPGSVIATKPWQTAPGDDISTNHTKQYGGAAKIDFDLDVGTLSLLTGYNHLRLDAVGPFYAAVAPDACFLTFTCIDYGLVQRSEEFSQEVNFASRNFGILSFVTGLYYYHGKGGADGVVQERFIPGGVLVQEDNFNTKSYAAYGEGTLKPTDSLSIVGGLRYSHDSIANGNGIVGVAKQASKNFNSLTPRVSVLYKLSPDLNVYATYSKGFKSGNSGAANYGAPTPFIPVQPEKLSAYEVGLKFATRNMTFNLAGYYYDYRNKQEQTFTGTSNFILNTGPIRIYGLDADANIRLTPDFSVTGTLSWIPKAQFRDFKNAAGQSTVLGPGGFLPGIGNMPTATFDATGFRLIRTPKVTASTTLNYAHQAAGGKFDASTTFSYASRSQLEITGTITQAPYASIAAQAGYRFDSSGIRVGVYGRNLTNKNNLVGAFSTSGGFFGTPTPPREIGISLNYAM